MSRDTTATMVAYTPLEAGPAAQEHGDERAGQAHVHEHRKAEHSRYEPLQQPRVTTVSS